MLKLFTLLLNSGLPIKVISALLEFALRKAPEPAVELLYQSATSKAYKAKVSQGLFIEGVKNVILGVRQLVPGGDI